MGNLKVCDLMTEDVVTVREDDHLATLYDLMFERHIRHLPVVDEDENLIGLISHRDLLKSALFTEDSLPVANERQLLESIQASEIMTTEPETIQEHQSITIAAETILENKIGCLIVVEGEKIVGILTEADFVKYVSESQG